LPRAFNGAKHHYKCELRFENGSSLGMLVSAGSNTDTELEEEGLEQISDS